MLNRFSIDLLRLPLSINAMIVLYAVSSLHLELKRNYICMYIIIFYSIHYDNYHAGMKKLYALIIIYPSETVPPTVISMLSINMMTMTPPKYLELHRAFLLKIGVWNLERKSVLYKIYRIIMVGYFCLYLLRQIVQLYFIIGVDNDEAIKNAGLSMMCLITICKVSVCINSGSNEIIKFIKFAESKFAATRKKKILEIYTYYTRYNKLVLISFYLYALMVTTASFISPMMEEQLIGGLEKRPLPTSVWFPFDSQKFYHFAYLIQFFDVNFGCHFVVGTDMFLVSTIIFAICQIKVLHHRIRTSRCDDLPYILEDHRLIIRYSHRFINLHFKLANIFFYSYVEKLNNLLKKLMFLDFLLCSIHLAVLAFKVVVVS